MGRILVVEDNELNSELLIRFLRRDGHKITLAVDGLKALEAVAAGEVDIILMDLNLPELDGWEATRRLKADRQQSTSRSSPSPRTRPPPTSRGRWLPAATITKPNLSFSRA